MSVRPEIQKVYPADKGTRIIGIIGILAGVFALLSIVSDALLPAPTTSSAIAQQLSTFDANKTLYAFHWAADILEITFGIAFVGGFSRIVWRKSQSVSTAAALLVAAALLAVAIDESLFVGPLFVISSAAPPTTADATYLAAVVAGLELDWIFVAMLLAGVGLVLFGWLIWEGEIFPRWLSRVALVIGVLYFVPPITDILPSTFSLLAPFSLLGADVLVLVWFFEAGVVLLRNKSKMV